MRQHDPYQLGVQLGALAAATADAPHADDLPDHDLIRRLRRAAASDVLAEVCHTILDEAHLTATMHTLHTTTRELLSQLGPHPPARPPPGGTATPP